LPGAASARPNESAQREIALFSIKENRKNPHWPVALHLNCFGVAAASAGTDEPRCLSSRHRLRIDTSSCRTVLLADLANTIPRSSYLFGVSWPVVRRTLVATVQQNGDPYAVIIPTTEIVRFYDATSTRLAHALSWGEYNQAFNAERSGVFKRRGEGTSTTLAGRSRCLDVTALHLLACDAARSQQMYQSLQLCKLKSTSLLSEPDQALPCGLSTTTYRVPPERIELPGVNFSADAMSSSLPRTAETMRFGVEQQLVCDKISLEQLVANATLAAEIAANPRVDWHRHQN
jgi:hypothetical protein